MNQIQSIRILVADDHPVVLEGLAMILDNEPDMTVVGQATNGQEAVDLFRKQQPDVTLLDVRMPSVGGAEAVAQIRAEFPDACIIMLTIYDGDEDIYQALQAGAKSYLLKNTPCNDILATIRQVCAGSNYIPPPIGVKLAQRLCSPQLSSRECEVLSLMAAGKSNKEIAAAMSISEGTVKSHINKILEKLKVNDRTQAVLVALQRGIVYL